MLYKLKASSIEAYRLKATPDVDLSDLFEDQPQWVTDAFAAKLLVAVKVNDGKLTHVENHFDKEPNVRPPLIGPGDYIVRDMSDGQVVDMTHATLVSDFEPIVDAPVVEEEKPAKPPKPKRK